MLQIKNIKKDYVVSDDLTVHALKDVSINFRRSEFVAVLGPSGCGKTTLLNILGGLDKYTSGDLVINGKSTKDYSDREWDTYRNHSVGFVFQSYNLIPHLNVVNNVAMALTLAGVPKSERIARATRALEKVGLKNELKKRPNQLSGGQMQRVAIARAIVNDPDIVLADEPTGALDSETGIQVMELLKEVAEDRLVIMVTHNALLAEEYASRTISLFDGELVGDTNPYPDIEAEADSAKLLEEKAVADVPREGAKRKKAKKEKLVSMSLGTAFGLSFKNLIAKKGRTLMTSFAGSIGIFGICLILAISTGMSQYVDNVQSEAIGNSAITISETTIDLENMMSGPGENTLTAYPTGTTGVTPYNKDSQRQTIHNNLSDEYVSYINAINKDYVKTIEYSYSVKMNVITETASGYKLISTRSSGMGGGSNWYDVSSQAISNQTLITDSYDVLYKTTDTGLPKGYTEVSLVVDKYNRLPTTTFDALGISYDENLSEISYASLVGKEFKIIPNDAFYTYSDGVYKPASTAQELETLYNADGATTLKIVGILRAKNDDATSWLSSGIVYSSELTEFVMNDAKNSEVGLAQINSPTKNVLTGMEFEATATSTVESQYVSAMKNIGVYSSPTSISIYPADIDAKGEVTAYLDGWNTAHADDKVVYTDFSEVVMSLLSTLIDVVTYILVGFSAVSLVVSTVMIGVTTYTSVIERTKEIGVLRSLGARKKDISHIFNAETIMIGGTAGVIGVIVAALIGALANLLLGSLIGISTIVDLTWSVALIMIGLSILLTWIAGLVPAKIAAKKDPVIALRTE